MSAAMASARRLCSSVNTGGGMKPRTATADQPTRASFSFMSSRLGMASKPIPVARRPFRYSGYAREERAAVSLRRRCRHTA